MKEYVKKNKYVLHLKTRKGPIVHYKNVNFQLIYVVKHTEKATNHVLNLFPICFA